MHLKDLSNGDTFKSAGKIYIVVENSGGSIAVRDVSQIRSQLFDPNTSVKLLKKKVASKKIEKMEKKEVNVKTPKMKVKATGIKKKYTKKISAETKEEKGGANASNDPFTKLDQSPGVKYGI